MHIFYVPINRRLIFEMPKHLAYGEFEVSIRCCIYEVKQTHASLFALWALDGHIAPMFCNESSRPNMHPHRDNTGRVISRRVQAFEANPLSAFYSTCTFVQVGFAQDTPLVGSPDKYTNRASRTQAELNKVYRQTIVRSVLVAADQKIGKMGICPTSAH